MLRPPMEGFQFIHRDTAMVAASCHNMLVACFVGPSEVQHLQVLKSAHHKLCMTYPGGIGTLVLLPSKLGGAALRDAPRPSPQVRDAILDALRSFEKNILGLAVVLDEDSLMASMKRSSTSAILMMSRNQHTRVFSGLNDASVWLYGRCAKSKERPWSIDQIQDLGEHTLQQVAAGQAGAAKA